MSFIFDFGRASSTCLSLIVECFLVVEIQGQTWTLNNDVDCNNVVSSKSGTSDDALTSVTCGSGYTMTGCTAKTNWKELDGSYMSSSGRCYARNGHGGNGVWAYGRCCNIHVSSCEVQLSSKSSTCDDCSTSVSCSSNNVLTGCTHVTYWKEMDGGYPGTASDQYKYSLSETNNYCTARNGVNGNGIWAQARCCEPQEYYKLECKTIWGTISGTGDDATSEITCPTDYFLSDCSVYTRWKELDGAYFSGDRCIAQNGIGGNGVWAVAVCCQEYYSPSPTQSPTDRPTNVPGLR